MGCGGAKGAAPADAKPANGDAGAAKPAAAAGGAKKPAGPQKITMTPDGKQRIVMTKYRMDMSKEAEMGQGTSSICRKGTDEKGEQIAIKVYKDTAKGTTKASEDLMLFKFRRQIEVLNSLQEPFAPVADKTLWHEALATAKPSSLFMTLLDWSKDETGPGQDPDDGDVYVITELAQYSLKDYLALRREQCRPIPKDSVKSITRAMILVMAGLHAKSLVHIDMKPENMMMFNGRLKLIDVDGCVKIGTSVSIQDSSISFSPCYCAPEWASFLINESNSKMNVQPCLDVWSTGMTISELVTLNALLKPMYGNFLRNAHSHREAGFLFMDWLSSIKKVPLPKNVEKYDDEFVALLHDWLLVTDKAKRKTCAQTLDNPYVLSAAKKSATPAEAMPTDEVMRAHRARPVDDTNSAPLHKGTLWKLNTGSDGKVPANWLKRDMWIAQQGSLCYYSSKENKKLILVEGARLADAEIKPYEGAVLMDGPKPAFTITYKVEDKDESITMAVNSKEDFDIWLEKLKTSTRMDMPTMQLGNHVAELRKFVVSVKNKRMKVDEADKTSFEPVFKEKLWKMKAEGDKLNAEHWFEREMWIAKNGALVYYSKKDERDLIYYTSADLMRASYTNVPTAESCKPFAFFLQLPEVDGVEFAPGEFAANSEELRTEWLKQLQNVQAK